MEYIACYRKNLMNWECQQGFNEFEEANKKILDVAKAKNCQTVIFSIFRYMPNIFKEQYIASKLKPIVQILFGANDTIY